MGVISLSIADLLTAASLVLVSALISLLLRMGLERQVLWAATRTVVQLLLVGHILRVVFAQDAPWLTALVLALMMGLAAREVAARPRERLAGRGNAWVGGLTVACTTVLTALFVLHTALRPDPWYDPRYIIALVGILLGSVLNAASLALDSMLSGIRRERAAIEAQLALGAPVGQAFAPLVRASVRRGIVPSVNQMAAAGIITLPGIMTGQIIAGMDPVEAAKYQILLMFLLCGASGLAAMGAAWLAMRRLTDTRDRLRLDRLLPERGDA
ncbi:MAG: iron export ABC transporter permease subunit FetB [Bordetella sp.]|nr:iron export ABC transporter permease subunit FetB [Bordetella sp.]